MFHKKIIFLNISTIIAATLIAGCQQQPKIGKALSEPSQFTSQPKIMSVNLNSNLTTTTQRFSPQTEKSKDYEIWYPVHKNKINEDVDTVFIDSLHGWKMVSGKVIGNITTGSETKNIIFIIRFIIPSFY